MTDTPKFEVVDRRKLKRQEEEQGGPPEQSPPAQSAPASVPDAVTPPAPAETAPSNAGPRLVVNEARQEPAQSEERPVLAEAQEAPGMPPAPTAEESRQQKAAYEASAQRLEDLLRAQNPGMGKPPAITFDHLVQQFYLSAMIQMGAGTQEGQRPQIDIVGARNTIDLLGVLAEKTKGNLTDTEDRTLQSVLFEVRMAFLDLTSMISMQSVPPPPPGKRPPGKH